MTRRRRFDICETYQLFRWGSLRWIRERPGGRLAALAARDPAMLLLAADHDDRVVPAHSYKFAAALQAAQACDRPVLLRVASDASHSYASTRAQIAERSDMWAFIAARLGVRIGRRGGF